MRFFTWKLELVSNILWMIVVVYKKYYWFMRGNLILIYEVIMIHEVQKIELINWDWLRIHYTAQRTSPPPPPPPPVHPPPKNVQLWQFLAKKSSFIFEFQLVPFAFSLTLGDLFMVSHSLSWCHIMGSVNFFQKKLFMGGQI